MGEVRIRLAESRADFDACVLLQREVWGLADLEITAAIQLIATTHAGGMVLLAEAGGRAVGFAYAFPALRGGVAHLHSDMLAVAPDQRRKGIGSRLKWAQREEALARGVSTVTWTFDPLQARNAHLNLHRLGASGTELLENLYGVTTSALHHGLPTDRLLVRWDLGAEQVLARHQEGAPRATATAPAASRINEVRWQAGWPVSSEPRLDLDAPELLLEIPPEWDVLCEAAPRVAQDWHGKVRRSFQGYLARGYAAADFVAAEEAGRRRPLYVLRRS